MIRTVRVDIRTSQLTDFIDITEKVQDAVRISGVKDGLCTLFVPHTTAGITINENADPDVLSDIKLFIKEKIPRKHPGYRHSEGNSSSHIMSSLFGSSLHTIIEDGSIALGTWQGVYFCEFDGPRTRRLWVKIVEG